MLTDDADNDEEDGGVILLSNQQMCYNYPQGAEQYKHKRDTKKHNEYHWPPRSSQFIWKKMLIYRKSNA